MSTLWRILTVPTMKSTPLTHLTGEKSEDPKGEVTLPEDANSRLSGRYLGSPDGVREPRGPLSCSGHQMTSRCPAERKPGWDIDG